jgi:hypothetical protein
MLLLHPLTFILLNFALETTFASAIRHDPHYSVLEARKDACKNPPCICGTAGGKKSGTGIKYDSQKLRKKCSKKGVVYAKAGDGDRRDGSLQDVNVRKTFCHDVV